MTIVTVSIADERIPGQGRPTHLHRGFRELDNAIAWAIDLNHLIGRTYATYETNNRSEGTCQKCHKPVWISD